VACTLSFGSVQWASGDPFTRRQALACLFHLASLFLLLLPVWASVSRMPGAIADDLPGADGEA
jgi:hypothetical protein